MNYNYKNYGPVLLPVDTIVKCPNLQCKANLWSVVKPLHEWQMPSQEHFQSITMEVKTWERFICDHCQTPFWKRGKFYTTKGWQPM